MKKVMDLNLLPLDHETKEDYTLFFKDINNVNNIVEAYLILKSYQQVTDIDKLISGIQYAYKDILQELGFHPIKQVINAIQLDKSCNLKRTMMAVDRLQLSDFDLGLDKEILHEMGRRLEKIRDPSKEFAKMKMMIVENKKYFPPDSKITISLHAHDVISHLALHTKGDKMVSQLKKIIAKEAEHKSRMIDTAKGLEADLRRLYREFINHSNIPGKKKDLLFNKIAFIRSDLNFGLYSHAVMGIHSMTRWVIRNVKAKSSALASCLSRNKSKSIRLINLQSMEQKRSRVWLSSKQPKSDGEHKKYSRR